MQKHLRKSKLKRLVIKIGSNIIADASRGLNLDVIERLAREISIISQEGYDIIIVSSGAVAAGMKKLGLKTKPKDIKFKQAAAAIGQSTLMWAYEKAFSEHDRKVAQILLTRDDFADRKKYINSKNTMITLLSYRIIPVINENDTVATDEIRFGDNDNLAALVAIMTESEKFVILSDVDGLYREDPKKNPHAEIIRTVTEITPEIENLAGGAGSAVGTGGMYSKILAAKKAVSQGIEVHIVNGRKTGVIISTVDGKTQGTVFMPSRRRMSDKKGWIAYSSRSKGTLIIDNGAVKALLERGKSLLPSGIVSVEGEFETGDSVYCIDSEGRRIAKGLINYSSSDLRKIIGMNTSEIERVLGYKYSAEVIHRDNLAIL